MFAPVCLAGEKPQLDASPVVNFYPGARPQYDDENKPMISTKIVAHYPHKFALKMGHRASTYGERSSAANRVARAILANLEKGQEPVGLLFQGN
jgi:hypothetical protein